MRLSHPLRPLLVLATSSRLLRFPAIRLERAVRLAVPQPPIRSRSLATTLREPVAAGALLMPEMTRQTRREAGKRSHGCARPSDARRDERTAACRRTHLFAFRVAALLIVVAGCSGSGRPSPTPAGFEAIFEGLVIRGVAVEETVGGDPGCDRPELRDNALRAGIRYEGVAYDLHLFAFRNPRAFDASARDLDACQREYAQQQRDLTARHVQAGPYRAFGAGWGPRLEVIIEDALKDAAAGGR